MSRTFLSARRALAAVSVASSLFAAACGGKDDSAAGPSVDCNATTVPKFADVTIFQVCTKCHATSVPNRQGAPQSVNFDSYASASANAELAAAAVRSGAMPEDHTPVTDAQKQALYAWAACGTPQ